MLDRQVPLHAGQLFAAKAKMSGIENICGLAFFGQASLLTAVSAAGLGATLTTRTRIAASLGLPLPPTTSFYLKVCIFTLVTTPAIVTWRMSIPKSSHL